MIPKPPPTRTPSNLSGLVRSGRGATKPLPAAAGVLVLIGLVLASYFGLLANPGAAPPVPVQAKTKQTATTTRAEHSDASEPAEPPSPPAIVAGAGATTEIRIGTWNIEWLGKPMDRSGLGQGVAQSTADMADYISFANVDVLALQEISPQGQSAGTKPPTSPELDAVIAELSERSGARWRSALMPGRSQGDQLCGIAWNSDRLTVIDAGDKPAAAGQERPVRLAIKPGRSSQGSGLWNRPPQALKFSAGPGKTDFVLCVLHMKADYKGDFAAQRGEEAAGLVAALPSLKNEFHDQDLVLLGDTNITAPASRPEDAETTLVAAGFVDINTKAEQTHWRGGATDRIFVPRGQPEFTKHPLEVMSDRWLEAKRWTPKDFKRRLSDHYMVVTSITIGDDDD